MEDKPLRIKVRTKDFRYRTTSKQKEIRIDGPDGYSIDISWNSAAGCFELLSEGGKLGKNSIQVELRTSNHIYLRLVR